MSTLKFVQTPEVALYNTIAATDTSMRVTPYPVDLDGNKLAFSDFGDSPALTVDPEVSGIEEIMLFNNIVDNGDNTATITISLRDVISKSPYNTGGTGRQHGSGAVVVFSNNPQMYNRLVTKENDETITGRKIFPSDNISNAGILADVDTSIATAFVTFGQLSRQAIAGAANASTTVKGLVELATQAETDARTTTGGTGALLVITPDKLRSTLLADYVPESGATVTVTIASPGVFSLTSHGLSANDTVVFSTSGALPTGLTAGVTYFVIAGGLTANAFEVAATLGGSAINTTGAQSGVHTVYRANTYVFTPSPAFTSLVAGQTYTFIAKCANTGAATANPNGLGAVPIKKYSSTALAAGDISAGLAVTLKYDGVNMQMQNPVSNAPLLASVVKFGGTGVDGALTITSGTTTIDLAGATVFIKNYSSVSITGTGSLAFINPAAGGTIIIFKCSGSWTVTSSTVPAIDFRNLGGAAGLNSTTNTAGSQGCGGYGGSSAAAAGSAPSSTGNCGSSGIGTDGGAFGFWIPGMTIGASTAGKQTTGSVGASPLVTSSSSARFVKAMVIPGAGGGSGQASGNGSGSSGGAGVNGGRGGGAFYFEVAGSYTCSSTINLAGAAGVNSVGSAGGGGGGGGSLLGLCGSIVSDTGTYTVTGGVAGTSGTFGTAGGSGANGYSAVTLNTEFL